MKRFITAALLIFLVSPVFAQNQFQVLTERPNEKTLKGIISREVLLADTSFKWYAQNLKSYTPYADAVTALRKNADSVQLIAFIGTWCEDSHFVIPRLYSVLDAAGFSTNKMSLLGVDRAKTTLSHLTEALNIINVPTIIIMKNGKELGRVVEYGKYGLFEKELAEILTAASR